MPERWRAYAGSAPVTRASGRSTSITVRHIKNDRLANTGWVWAFAATKHCQPAGLHYRRRRDHGDRHAAANRHLFDQSKAFPPTTAAIEDATDESYCAAGLLRRTRMRLVGADVPVDGHGRDRA
jgi:hypothetical protein